MLGNLCAAGITNCEVPWSAQVRFIENILEPDNKRENELLVTTLLSLSVYVHTSKEFDYNHVQASAAA